MGRRGFWRVRLTRDGQYSKWEDVCCTCQNAEQGMGDYKGWVWVAQPQSGIVRERQGWQGAVEYQYLFLDFMTVFFFIFKFASELIFIYSFSRIYINFFLICIDFR